VKLRDKKDAFAFERKRFDICDKTLRRLHLNAKAFESKRFDVLNKTQVRSWTNVLAFFYGF